MKKLALMAGIAAALLAGSVLADDKPYRDGPVTVISSIKLKPGKFDEYMRYLAGPYKASMEEQKKAGYVLSYAVYTTNARTPHDPDLYLTVTYPNMATLDKGDEMQAAAGKVLGNIQEMNKGFADRSTMREPLGTEIIREQILK